MPDDDKTWPKKNGGWISHPGSLDSLPSLNIPWFSFKLPIKKRWLDFRGIAFDFCDLWLLLDVNFVPKCLFLHLFWICILSCLLIFVFLHQVIQAVTFLSACRKWWCWLFACFFQLDLPCLMWRAALEPCHARVDSHWTWDFACAGSFIARECLASLPNLPLPRKLC